MAYISEPLAWWTFEKMKMFDRKDKGRDEDVSKTRFQLKQTTIYLKNTAMRTTKQIKRQIKAHAVTMIWCKLTEFGFRYRRRDIRKMVYFDKNWQTWAVRILVEKYWAPKYDCGEFGDCSMWIKGQEVLRFEVFTYRG